MKVPSFKLLLALFCVLTATAISQQTTPLSKRAAEIKRRVGQLSPHAPISVIPLHGEEEFGSFISGQQNDFTFYDIDRKSNVTLSYTEIRGIENGYGGYNTLQRRHTDRGRALLVIAVAAGALVAVIVAAAIAQ